MDDLISRQAAIDAMAELQGRASTKAELKGISKAWKRIKQLPSAQHKKGKWVINGTLINCSVCKHSAWSRDVFEETVRRFNFCPNCGCDMRGGDAK